MLQQETEKICKRTALAKQKTSDIIVSKAQLDERQRAVMQTEQIINNQVEVQRSLNYQRRSETRALTSRKLEQRQTEVQSIAQMRKSERKSNERQKCLDLQASMDEAKQKVK